MKERGGGEGISEVERGGGYRIMREGEGRV